MNTMDIHALPAGAGKTKNLVESIVKFGGRMVCFNESECDRVLEWATKELGHTRFPRPISWDRFLSREYDGMNESHFYIDNLDLCLAYTSMLPIQGISLTYDPAIGNNFQPDNP